LNVWSTSVLYLNAFYTIYDISGSLKQISSKNKLPNI